MIRMDVPQRIPKSSGCLKKVPYFVGLGCLGALVSLFFIGVMLVYLAKIAAAIAVLALAAWIGYAAWRVQIDVNLDDSLTAELRALGKRDVILRQSQQVAKRSNTVESQVQAARSTLATVHSQIATVSTDLRRELERNIGLLADDHRRCARRFSNSVSPEKRTLRNHQASLSTNFRLSRLDQQELSASSASQEHTTDSVVVGSERSPTRGVQQLGVHRLSRNAWLIVNKLADQFRLQRLLTDGERVYGTSEDGYTELHHVASALGAEELLSKGADMGARAGDYEQTPLMMAVILGHTDVLQALLEHGADVDESDASGATAVHYAAQRGATEALGILIKQGGNTGPTKGFSLSAVGAAAANGHTDAVDLLLAEGATVEIADIGTTAAHGHQDLARRLYAELTTPDVLAASSVGDCATLSKHLDSERTGSLVSDRQTMLNRCLRTASGSGQEQVVKMLLERGADVNAASKNGLTALHLATVSIYPELVQLLVDQGAETDSADDEGETALYKAVALNRRPAVKILMQSGADTQLRTREGKRPYDVARSRRLRRALCPREKRRV